MSRRPRVHALAACFASVTNTRVTVDPPARARRTFTGGLFSKLFESAYPKSNSSSKQPLESIKPQVFKAQTAGLLSFSILGYTLRIVLFE